MAAAVEGGVEGGVEGVVGEVDVEGGRWPRVEWSLGFAALGFAAKKVNDRWYRPDDKTADPSHFSSEWLVVARRPEHLARFLSERSKTRNLIWEVPPADEAPAWRDGVEPDMPSRR